MTDGGRGYQAGNPPAAKVESPPFLQDMARATTVLKRSGSVFKVALRAPGKGYEVAPKVVISSPRCVHAVGGESVETVFCFGNSWEQY